MPVNGPPPAINGGPLVSALRKSGSKDAPSVDQAELLRIAPASPVSCRGPYEVTDKITNGRFATIELSSELSSNLSVTWQVAVSEANAPHRPLTRSVHVENEASKEWEVSVRDGNGSTVYQYAYKRFNPAHGAQRMNVTDDAGAIVAVIEYVSRSELRVYTCTDSVSPLVTGKEAGNSSSPAPTPAAAASPAPAFLQRRAEPAEPSPDAKPRGPDFKGSCDHPLETARLTQSWGDSASHAWTLQRFRDAKHPPPLPAQLRAGDGARFVESGGRAVARAAAHRFAGGSYDVLLLLELSALVSHSEAPWCLAVTCAYVVITASVVLLGGVAAVQLMSRPRPRRRRRKQKRSKAPTSAAGSAAGSDRPKMAASSAAGKKSR